MRIRVSRIRSISHRKLSVDWGPGGGRGTQRPLETESCPLCHMGGGKAAEGKVAAVPASVPLATDVASQALPRSSNCCSPGPACGRREPRGLSQAAFCGSIPGLLGHDLLRHQLRLRAQNTGRQGGHVQDRARDQSSLSVRTLSYAECHDRLQGQGILHRQRVSGSSRTPFLRAPGVALWCSAVGEEMCAHGSDHRATTP